MAIRLRIPRRTTASSSRPLGCARWSGLTALTGKKFKRRDLLKLKPGASGDRRMALFPPTSFSRLFADRLCNHPSSRSRYLRTTTPPADRGVGARLVSAEATLPLEHNTRADFMQFDMVSEWMQQKTSIQFLKVTD